MNNQLKIFLFCFLFLFIIGCAEEAKKETATTPPKPRQLMSRETELSSSLEVRVVIKTSEKKLDKKVLKDIFKDHHGIHSIDISQGNIAFLYNPSVITPDSIKKLLVRKNISVTD